MSKYSEQDLKYAAELRDEIHREALAIVRKTCPNITEVIDRHPVEDYFQESWDYPGKWYTIVAIPYGYRNRKAFVDAIVHETLFGVVAEDDVGSKRELMGSPKQKEITFCPLSDEYPELVLDYCFVKDESYHGYESHRKALISAYGILCDEWEGDPGEATGKCIPTEELFSSECQKGKLNYRRAFLNPPHQNSYTGKDFERFNAAIFPNGTDKLEVYEWDTNWSDYFDDGHEWWGTLCLTVYDQTLDRFVVIMASATD